MNTTATSDLREYELAELLGNIFCAQFNALMFGSRKFYTRKRWRKAVRMYRKRHGIKSISIFKH